MRLAEQLVTEYKVVWGNMVKETVISDLITEFNKANVNLREYALERESLENGRAIIRSNRDRMNPMTPRELLKELRKRKRNKSFFLTEQDKNCIQRLLLVVWVNQFS